jgi:hypothetical protein
MTRLLMELYIFHEEELRMTILSGVVLVYVDEVAKRMRYCACPPSAPRAYAFTPLSSEQGSPPITISIAGGRGLGEIRRVLCHVETSVAELTAV